MTDFESEVQARLAGIDLRLAEMARDVRALCGQVTVQNGRVGKMEELRRSDEILAAERRGAERARAGMAFSLTRGQWAMLTAVLSFVIAAVTALPPLLERL